MQCKLKMQNTFSETSAIRILPESLRLLEKHGRLCFFNMALGFKKQTNTATYLSGIPATSNTWVKSISKMLGGGNKCDLIYKTSSLCTTVEILNCSNCEVSCSDRFRDKFLSE